HSFVSPAVRDWNDYMAADLGLNTRFPALSFTTQHQRTSVAPARSRYSLRKPHGGKRHERPTLIAPGIFRAWRLTQFSVVLRNSAGWGALSRGSSVVSTGGLCVVDVVITGALCKVVIASAASQAARTSLLRNFISWRTSAESSRTMSGRAATAS